MGNHIYRNRLGEVLRCQVKELWASSLGPQGATRWERRAEVCSSFLSKMEILLVSQVGTHMGTASVPISMGSHAASPPPKRRSPFPLHSSNFF